MFLFYDALNKFYLWLYGHIVKNHSSGEETYSMVRAFAHGAMGLWIDPS